MEAMVIVSKISFKILAPPQLSPLTSYATKYLQETPIYLNRIYCWVVAILTRILSRPPPPILDTPSKIDFSTL